MGKDKKAFKKPEKSLEGFGANMVDLWTELNNAFRTLGASAIGDAVNGISPKAADLLYKGSLGLLPHTTISQLDDMRQGRVIDRLGNTSRSLTAGATKALFARAVGNMPKVFSEGFAEATPNISRMGKMIRTKEGFEIPEAEYDEIFHSSQEAFGSLPFINLAIQAKNRYMGKPIQGFSKYAGKEEAIEEQPVAEKSKKKVFKSSGTNVGRQTSYRIPGISGPLMEQ